MKASIPVKLCLNMKAHVLDEYIYKYMDFLRLYFPQYEIEYEEYSLKTKRLNFFISAFVPLVNEKPSTPSSFFPCDWDKHGMEYGLYFDGAELEEYILDGFSLCLKCVLLSRGLEKPMSIPTTYAFSLAFVDTLGDARFCEEYSLENAGILYGLSD